MMSLATLEAWGLDKTYPLETLAIGAVKQDRVAVRLPHGAQHDPFWTVQTEMHAARFLSSPDQILSHFEMIWVQLSNVT